MQQSILKLAVTALTGLTLSIGLVPKAQAKTVALKFDVPAQSTVSATISSSKPVALTFSRDSLSKPTNQHSIPEAYSIDDLFTGGVDSLVSKAVGSAEGTRTPTGGYTSAYYGHVDPGNGVWNLGSFSYQHGAASPEDADKKQLRQLQRQTLELRQQAQTKDFSLSLLEELNGIDLANQAPLAALDRGYINWLFVAKQHPMDRGEQVIWARTKAFLDPDTGYWDAPGLGNHWDAIYRDQQRRYNAILRTIDSH
ncbi:MAG: hypothetical protein F6K11_11980 [Leptolyngbya sp. SIO3F4]|nr:hypothetical protein [Leptolyngbya sp. SIO3F4]